MRNLELLDLRYTGVTGAGVRALRAALPNVRVTFVDTAPPVLTSKVAPPRDAGRRRLRKWVQSMGGNVRRGDKGIRYISLARTRLTDAQVKYLVGVAGLEELNLEATDVSDAAMDSLAKIRTLRDLNLSFTGVSDRGIERLAPLVNLQRLNLAACRITGSGFAALKAGSTQDPGPWHEPGDR